MEIPMEDNADRIEAIEDRIAALYGLMKHVADALAVQRARIDEEHARLRAHALVTAAMLQGFGRLAPVPALEIIALLERSTRHLAVSEAHEATVQELREIVSALRSQQRIAEHSGA
jgi:hypothetical protein